jgi:hypothetical protein
VSFIKTILKQTIIIFLSTISLFSCSTTPDKETIYYVVKHPERVDQKPEIPQPPVTYYGKFNFILFDSSKIYYHTAFVDRSCGYGTDDSRPPRVFLTPDSLTEIKSENIESFLKENIPSEKVGERFFASISSPTDTIKNSIYKTITDYFKSVNINRYNVRNLTEEEQFSLDAKLQNKPYDPTSIDWKVGFDIEPLTKKPEKGEQPIWLYDYSSFPLPVKNRKVSPDTLTPEKLVKLINSCSSKETRLDFVKISQDTIFVKIKDSQFLTQRMGSSGADDYMTTSTFTLTELKDIKYVNYDFEEGDHAAPGTYSRQYFLDRNK